MDHKIGPALAAGNAVVGKPAMNTLLVASSSSSISTQATHEVDVPDGIINILMGKSSTIGDVFLARS